MADSDREMTVIVKQPATLAAGAAVVIMGATARWMGAIPLVGDPRRVPSLTPYLLLGAAHLVMAVGMLLTLRTRRPRSLLAWSMWGFTLVTVMASSPIPAGWIAGGLETLTGLTNQNGPQWFLWPVNCLVLAALISQVVGRDGDRPSMTVVGLTASLALPMWLWTYYFGGLASGRFTWPVPAAVWLLVVGVQVSTSRAHRRRAAVRGRRAKRPDKSVGGPRPRIRIVIGMTLFVAGAAMTAAQLIRWHTCLGWRWAEGEAGCGTVQSDTYDYGVLPFHPTRLPGAATLHGLGLLLLATALASALIWMLVAAPRRRRGTPARSRWISAREVGTGVLWAVLVAAVAVTGIASVTSAYPSSSPVNHLSLLPLVFWATWCGPLVAVAVACLVAVNGRNDDSARWWTLHLIRLFVGLALTNFLVEFFFWSGVYASYDTPPFTGQLRALVLLIVGFWLLRAPKRDLAVAP